MPQTSLSTLIPKTTIQHVYQVAASQIASAATKTTFASVVNLATLSSMMVTHANNSAQFHSVTVAVHSIIVPAVEIT